MRAKTSASADNDDMIRSATHCANSNKAKTVMFLMFLELMLIRPKTLATNDRRPKIMRKAAEEWKAFDVEALRLFFLNRFAYLHLVAVSELIK